MEPHNNDPIPISRALHDLARRSAALRIPSFSGEKRKLDLHTSLNAFHSEPARSFLNASACSIQVKRSRTGSPPVSRVLKYAASDDGFRNKIDLLVKKSIDRYLECVLCSGILVDIERESALSGFSTMLKESSLRIRLRQMQPRYCRKASGFRLSGQLSTPRKSSRLTPGK